MFSRLKQIFSRDLGRKVVFVLLMLAITRILAHIPMPGVNIESLKNFFDQNEAFGLLNLFTGGAMRNFSLVMLGIGPFITSSIIFQLLTMVVPSLEALSKEGEQGRQKINYYTRIATVPLAFIQSYAMITLLKSQGIIIGWNSFDLITMLITLTAGTMLLVWIGELISENGVGNGISLIIALGIIAGVPTQLGQTISSMDSTKIVGLIVFVLIAALVTAAIVFVNDGERQIPITYARRIRGIKSSGGFDTYLPLRVTMAGVIPIIFALSVMVIPSVISKFFEQAKSPQLSNIAQWVGNLFSNNIFYGIFYFVMVIAFTFFYTSVIFQPNTIAENLQKRGGFMPGMRPGRETAEYLSSVIFKITLVGAIFLAFVAVLPFIAQALTNLKTLVLGGTGILIVISVILETKRQIESQIIMKRYEKY